MKCKNCDAENAPKNFQMTQNIWNERKRRMKRIFVAMILLIALYGCAKENMNENSKLLNISEAETELDKKVAIGFVIRIPKNDCVKTIIVADENHKIFYYDLRK